ncbi:MAG: sigma-70 family RNA polymerase sigma factor [Chthoniobacteraceae bacterium]|nr:sigma-70 family RNA polymerase sigma factor [Chthoniobacteraceae bacterium]
MDADRDTDFMLRLRQGDDLALNALMREWQTPLLRFIYRYIGDESEALDLAQETFVRVYQNRASYRPGARFSSWLYTIAANLCRNHLRWERRHPAVSLTQDAGEEGDSPSSGMDSLPNPGATPATAAEQNDTARCVRECIQALPHDLKTVILLFEYEGLSHGEIAEIAGCSPKAVETRLYRARNILRGQLERLVRG